MMAGPMNQQKRHHTTQIQNTHPRQTEPHTLCSKEVLLEIISIEVVVVVVRLVLGNASMVISDVSSISISAFCPRPGKLGREGRVLWPDGARRRLEAQARHVGAERQQGMDL